MKVVTEYPPDVVVELVKPAPTLIVYVFGYLIMTMPDPPLPPVPVATPDRRPPPPPPPPVLELVQTAVMVGQHLTAVLVVQV